MAYFISDAFLDATLNDISGCTNLNYCVGQPATIADIAAASKLQRTLTGTDYAITDGAAGGRLLTVASSTSITATGDGALDHAVLDDGVRMLAIPLPQTLDVVANQSYAPSEIKILQEDPSAA